MTAGVLGGSFDPPHLGHLGIATAAMRFLALERVLFIPCFLPAHKRPATMSPFETRWLLLNEALSGHADFQALAVERDRGGVSYTVDTLEELRRRYPNGRFWLILGADSLADIPGWKTPERIVRMARIAVYGRVSAERGGEPYGMATPAADPGGSARESAEPPGRSGFPERAGLPAFLEGRVTEIPGPLFDVSSTDIRGRVREGKSVEGLVAPGVARLIERLGLYRDEPPAATRAMSVDGR